MFRNYLNQETIADVSRMLPWLLLSIFFYWLALNVEHIQLQTLFWKIGHLNISAHLGYWIARKTLGRIYPDTPSTARVARAIVIVGAMLAVSQGL